MRGRSRAERLERAIHEAHRFRRPIKATAVPAQLLAACVTMYQWWSDRLRQRLRGVSDHLGGRGRDHKPGQISWSLRPRDCCWRPLGRWRHQAGGTERRPFWSPQPTTGQGLAADVSSQSLRQEAAEATSGLSAKGEHLARGPCSPLCSPPCSPARLSGRSPPGVRDASTDGALHGVQTGLSPLDRIG